MALVYTEDSGNKYLGNDTNPYLVFMEAATGSTSITVKDGCKVIADMAFLGMSSLNSVTFPEGLTHICKDALKLCENLNTKITIPESVVSIGAGAFVGCVSLTEIEVAEGNSVYKSQDNCIIEKATNKLVVGIKTSIIPKGVEIIGEQAFTYARFATIEIPNTVTTIEYEAFANSSTLETISIPNSVTNLEESAFRSCSKLETVVLGSGLKCIKHWTFRGCDKLTSVTMADSITYICDSAFPNCFVLTSVEWSNNLVLIDEAAFSNCDALATIVLPNSVESIGAGAFDDCMATSIIIPESVKHIFGRISYTANPEKYYCEAISEPHGFSNNWNNDKPVYWYSETENKDGSHWRYVDGVPTVWE